MNIRPQLTVKPALAYAVSFAAGMSAGLVFWLLRTAAPVPPLLGLLGLLGIAVGEASVVTAKHKRRNESRCQ